MRTALVAYVPVLHAGYLKLIEKVRPAAIFLLDEELLSALPEEFDYIKRKDVIRALPTETMRSALEAISGVPASPLSTHESVVRLYDKIVMPDEDASRYVSQSLFKDCAVDFESIFLRWDRQAVVKQEAAEVVAGVTISMDELDRLFLQSAEQKAQRSWDWWRQVGAVLVIDGVIIYAASNEHRPHPQAPNAFGDPRSLFKRGVRIECSTAEHAEAALIAEAAYRGVSTKGASLYVTAFPCPACAKLVAHARVGRCVFSGGYSVLDGADDMRRHGVELVYVNLKK